MKIRRIQAYRVELPLREGSYKWSGGKAVTVFDSTVVRIETDAGVIGHGEVCPLVRSICPPTPTACAPASRAGATSPRRNPLELLKFNRRMDAALKGHAYVKSALDMAAGHPRPGRRATGVYPAWRRFGEDFVLYRAISQESPRPWRPGRRYRARVIAVSSSRSAGRR